ncbi:MAG: DUF368 domain-containing protein [Clostridia bacterium]|nr:DUF368 domain-containing protein [Clostridia bacterium]
MKYLLNFIKGIVVGIGGVAPGLSGSVMMLILGLYEDVIEAISTIFANFKKNIKLLIPIGLGMGVGILIFSKIVDYFLGNYEFAPKYLFLGLVVGTVPLFYKSVTKNGYKKSYYIIVAAALFLGIYIFTYNKAFFPTITEPNFIQSMLLGVAVAGSSIVPGVDSAAILSSFGLYKLYVESVADLQFSILLPAGLGLLVGGLLISAMMNILIKKCYAVTFSVIFGLFISIIPTILMNDAKTAYLTPETPEKFLLAAGLAVFGFALSFYLGDIRGTHKKVKNIFGKKKK